MSNTVDYLVCAPSPGMSGTDGQRQGIPDFSRACQQHHELCLIMANAGLNPVSLKTDPLADNAALVSGLAVITPTLAIMAHDADRTPNAGGRQELANRLATDRILKFISPPGTMNAQDVVLINGSYYIGLSSRTNEEGAGQLAFFLKEYGYEATIIPPLAGNDAPLQNLIAALPDGRVLIDRALENQYVFMALDKIVTDEAGAAGGLTLGHTYFMPAGFKKTSKRLKSAGITIGEINISEFEKTGAGLSNLVLCAPHRTQKQGAVVLPFTSANKTQVA